MGLSVHSHPGPSVLDNSDVCGVNVLVSFDEVGSQYRSELLGRSNGMLLCHDIGSVLHGVCRNNNAVVCFGVTKLLSITDMNNSSPGILTRFQSRLPAER